MKVWQHAIALCLPIGAVFITLATGFSTVPPLTCSVQRSDGVSVPCISSGMYKEGCKFDDRRDVARGVSSTSSFGLQEEEEEEEDDKDDIILKEKPLNLVNSLIDINFPLWHTRQAVVIVTGIRVRWWGRRRRCVVVTVTSSEAGRVTLHDLSLPHGSYQVRVVKKRNSTEDGGGGRGAKNDGMTVTRRQLVLPSNRRQDRARVRKRRHKNPASRPYSGGQGRLSDIIFKNFGMGDQTLEEEEIGGGMEGSLSPYRNDGDYETGDDVAGSPSACYRCYNFTVNYIEDKAVLMFDYHLNDTCDGGCSAVNVQLYRDGQSSSPDECDNNTQNLLTSERIGLDKNVTEGPIRYSNIDKGCYFVNLKPLLYPLPEPTSSFWLVPSINVTDMDIWDTFFSLEPNPERQSLTVRWTVSEVYNFSAYQLTLHHHPTIPINCTGRAIYPNMSIIPPKERLVVRQPPYKFYNLSSGWYCARLTPRDDRCPLDGCQVLSSPPEQLTEPLERRCENGEADGEGCGKKPVLGLTLLVVGCVVGAVVTGVMVAWAILHTWPSLGHVFTSATQYSPVPIRPAVKTGAGGKKQIVLLVWTPQGPHGAKYAPIIAAFKTLLRTYSHCEVYDYLDLSSLPERQQLHLLASPTTWLDSILAQHSIKVIIVATEGAWQRQVEWKQLMPSPQKDTHSHLPSTQHAHDQLLFPYLLRRLHDQPDLAGDYSRVFHIRFSEVSHSSVELGNIVSWKRYKIPEHLRSLTISLHGGVGASSFEEPSDDLLKELRAAVSCHPHHCSSHISNGNGAPWPSLMTYPSLGPVKLTNGSTKTQETAVIER